MTTKHYVDDQGTYWTDVERAKQTVREAKGEKVGRH